MTFTLEFCFVLFFCEGLSPEAELMMDVTPWTWWHHPAAWAESESKTGKGQSPLITAIPLLCLWSNALSCEEGQALLSWTPLYLPCHDGLWPKVNATSCLLVTSMRKCQTHSCSPWAMSTPCCSFSHHLLSSLPHGASVFLSYFSALRFLLASLYLPFHCLALL